MISRNRNSNNSPSLQKATLLLNISKSGFYKWSNNNIIKSKNNKIEMEIKNQIHKIAIDFPGYGYRRITKELNHRGYNVNHKRILRYMREDNLLCIKKKFKPLTTDSNHEHKIYPNLVKDLDINRMNHVWASDITYIQLNKEFVYLAVIIDLFSRKCIGWELSRNIDSQLVLNALDKAIKDRWNHELCGLIHHSDQGVQYASDLYILRLQKHNILISMSRKGNPYDNAFVESFIKTLKYEEVYLNEYNSYWDAFENISNFIDNVYNKKRLHSSLEYQSPIDFEHRKTLKRIT